MFLSLGERNTKSMGGSWDIDEFNQLFIKCPAEVKERFGLILYTMRHLCVERGGGGLEGGAPGPPRQGIIYGHH